MKKIYTLIFFTITTSFLTAQTTVNFTLGEGFTSGALYSQTNWDSQFSATTWTVDPTAGGMTSVSAEYQRAAWEQGFSVSGSGESITFRVDLKFLGTFGTNNNPLIKIGFSSSSDVRSNNGVFLRTASFNSQLQLGNDGNSGPLSPNASLLIADCQAVGESDDLAVLVTLTLGADATSSTISAILKNLTDGTESAIGSYTGIAPLLFTEATTNIYGYFQSSGFKSTGGGGALTEIQVSSVTMTQGNTLNNVTWNGSLSSDWATAANWDSGSVPTGTKNVIIPDVATAPIIGSTTGAVTNDLTITEPEGINITAGGSLIVSGTSTGTGNVTYKTALAYNASITEGWHLVASPVVGETYDNDYVAANALAINGANNAIATYTTANNTWSYMQTNGGGTFTPGIGYLVKKQSSAGDISFTGTINTSDVSVGVFLVGTNNYNLIGNPYTSYLDSEAFLNGNSGNLLSTDIWVFNQATSNYENKNLAAQFKLAPAQGFFVRANAATNLTIAESYQASTGATFLKSAKTEITLNMNDGSNNRFAKIYYLDNATTGFDNGYDGETFGGISNSLDVFTHLVANSTGKKYQVQSLTNSDFENMVVPVGVKAAAGKEITFSLDAMNIPDGINVYIEDKTANTVTLLSQENATYKVTLAGALDGIGRFYLHTKASGVLSTETIAFDNVSVYTTDASTLRVAGLSQGKASMKLFSLLGKQVFETSFNATGVKDMQLPKLGSGIYVVQLTTEKGTLNKKITLK